MIASERRVQIVRVIAALVGSGKALSGDRFEGMRVGVNQYEMRGDKMLHGRWVWTGH